MSKIGGSAKNERRYDLDFLRVVAILAVIAIHCIAPLLGVGQQIGSPSWQLANFTDSFIRWCVPVFVMISGALLINETTYKKPKLFFQKRVKRILIPLTCWPIIYAVFDALVTGGTLDFAKIAKGFLAGAPAYGGHLYFLFLIAGLYVIAPLLSAYACTIPRRQLWKATFALCIAIAAWDLLTHLPGFKTPLNIFTQGLPYVGYFLLGYLMKDLRLHPSHEKLYATIFVASSTLIATATYFISKHAGTSTFILYDYTSILVLISSASVFMLGRFVYQRAELRVGKIRLFLDDLSKKSFGMYLVHLLLLGVIVRTLHLERASLKSVLIIFPLTVALSWCVVTILRRIPKTKYLLG